MGALGAILLWIAEATGSAVLKAMVERWFGKSSPAPDLQAIAEASRADARSAQAEQIAQAASDRAKVDQNVLSAGVGAARADMAKNWNQP